MSTILKIYQQNKPFILEKSIHQVLALAGDGKLKNNNQTCLEFRELLSAIPTDSLVKYANECLENKFEDSGLALQDIINQAGRRLDFEVKYGLYQGSKNTIGYDGIWEINDSMSIIIEVKTTDAYRINLDHIYSYKRKLVEQQQIAENASILIVVGRKDTGDLEAQIRGSRYGWDFRLISVNSLMKLVQLKENLNDEKTIKQISEILCPLEFTRLDKLIEIVFETTLDVQLEPKSEITHDIISEGESEDPVAGNCKNKRNPVNFQDGCLKRVENKLNITLIKNTRAGYETPDKEQGFLCCISKQHQQKNSNKYWFAFHPHQEIFLKKFKLSYIIYGCGNENNTFLIPFFEVQRNIKNLWTTENKGRSYWHIVIHERNNKFEWQIPQIDIFIDLQPYRV